ncbi:hypothetical protein MesoLjLc_23480 [Mesorhizobium sp. L-8-10]|nr:hypothetical protein MesoLjLc_23480 [Mesorhizobium sp. L-8-10]
MESGGSKTMRRLLAVPYGCARKGRAFQRLLLLVTVLASIFLASHQTQAEEAERDIFSELLTDKTVKTTLDGMLATLPSAQCAPGQACAPASPEEIATPPVSVEQARGAIRAGFISGLAEWCGLDWQGRVFQPLIDSYRNVDRLEPRIVTMLTLLHGYGQGQMVESMKTQQCSAAQRDSIDSLVSSVGDAR